MKIHRLAMAAALALGLLMNAGTASAAFVTNMGLVSAGDSGVIDMSHSGNLIVNSITGSLPSNSMITFSYDFDGNIDFGALSAGGQYAYNTGGSLFEGMTLDTTFSSPVAMGYTDGTPSPALALASAQIDFTGNTATAVIKNLSSGIVHYASLFSGLFSGAKTGTVSYVVSAVPLPAALPLFGLGLGAMAGFGIRRKKKLAA